MCCFFFKVICFEVGVHHSRRLFGLVFEKEITPLSYNDLWKKIKIAAPAKWKVSDKTAKEIVSIAEKKGMIKNEAEKGKKTKELLLSKTWKDE